MKCLNCGEEFTPQAVNQKYCCVSCQRKYIRTHDMDKEYPSITFTCARCGKTVVTEGGTKDKRTRFCSKSCEKKFWRKPHWENKSSNVTFQNEKLLKLWEDYIVEN